MEDIEAEKKEIMDTYLSMRFMKTFRQNALACYTKCGGKMTLPFMVEPAFLPGLKNEICFGDCMNMTLEKGPYLQELGDIPEDSIPVKFVWANSLQSQPKTEEE